MRVLPFIFYYIPPLILALLSYLMNSDPGIAWLFRDPSSIIMHHVTYGNISLVDAFSKRFGL